jgi:uncharacterized NAD(P)/FAD-binding protein YdhS
MKEPRRDHYIGPGIGEDSRLVVDAAIEGLCAARNLPATDAPACLHVIASLTAELTTRIGAAVAEARQYGCSWAEVADLLGVTRASAWQRYGGTENAVNDPIPRRPVP